MNLLKFPFLLVVILLGLSSCNSEKKDKNNEDKSPENKVIRDVDGNDFVILDADDMEPLSLREQGLNLKMKTPSISSSIGSLKPVVLHEEGTVDWAVKIGDKFKMIIQEWAPVHKPKNKVADEKEHISQSVFDVNYIVDLDSLIMYQRKIPSNENKKSQGGETSYHVFYSTKINGTTYVIKSAMDGGLKPVIKDMIKTMMTIEPAEEKKPA